MDQKKIGLFLRTLRKDKGLTQEQLADEMGVSNRTVSRWENGYNLPDFDVLLELSRFYGVQIDEIMNGMRAEEEMKPEEKTLNQIAEYTAEEKKQMMGRIHLLFLAGVIGMILFGIIEFGGIVSPLTDFLSGLGLGVAFGMLIFGAIMTSRYAKEIQAAKRRLLKRS